jgi:cysteinyl-tRNA synthetase
VLNTDLPKNKNSITMQKKLISVTLLSFTLFVSAQNSNLKSQTNQKAESLESKVISFRRDFHQNPELSNREFKTADKIASHLRSLGIEVQTGENGSRRDFKRRETWARCRS